MSAPLLLAGRRVTLRDWRFADLAAYERWMLPGHAWQDLDSPFAPPPTPDDVALLIARKRLAIAGQPLTPRASLVLSTPHDDTLLGTVTRYWESEETSWLCAGIAIFDSGYWRQGLGFEALGLWTDYLFRELPRIVRLDLRTWSGNVGMTRLALKLGYREEARFRKARPVGGAYYDGLGYGVLREEWQAAYPDGFAAAL